MKTYTVKFSINAVNGETPLDVAKTITDWIAEKNMQFTVQDEETKECFTVDLAEEDVDAVLTLTEEEFKKS